MNPNQINKLQQSGIVGSKAGLKTAKAWNTKLVEETKQMIDDGFEVSNPFWENDPRWRAGDITFDYTPEEREEIKKCAKDVVYFANKYAYSMTDGGVQKITLRDYQETFLRDLQRERFSISMQSRQTGKTVTVGIFLAWYCCFHFDRNALVMANKGATMVEIIDKIKHVFMNLPFFLKPGVISNNQGSMKFDNGCRLFGQATTKSAAIGFTIHLLYCDEFAHIPHTYLEPFYRSVYPTLSSSLVSRLIITSTPNGMNKFYEIYINSKNMCAPDSKSRNDFFATTIYWWQVPLYDEKGNVRRDSEGNILYRGEEWKQKEVANIGSEDMFNQEYGLQFLASNRTLLGTELLKELKDNAKEFVWREIEELSDMEIDYTNLKWDPLFDMEFDEFKDVITIDVAEGGGGDYSVINIFRMEPIPISSFGRVKNYKDESDFFRLRQIGVFRHNGMSPDDFGRLCAAIVNMAGPDRVKCVIEMNYKGDVILSALRTLKEYEDEIVLHTRHTEVAKYLKPGIRWNPGNKSLACQQLKSLMKAGKIVTFEKITYEELNSFGTNSKGKYSAMIGHDDLAMSIVNLTQLFLAEDWVDMVEEVYDETDGEIRKQIDNLIDNIDDDDDDGGNIVGGLREFM